MLNDETGVPELKMAQTDGLTDLQLLGKNIYFDKISSPENMACAGCHDPGLGFTGPNPGINLKGSVYRGAVPHRFGNRKPPSAAYAAFSPVLHIDEEGIFEGGNFWDGRATGEHFLLNPDAVMLEGMGLPSAEQALGPFLNPVEQNAPSKEDVLMQIAASKYAWLWEEVWGEPPGWASGAETDRNYDRVGVAIAAYEGSTEVNPFTSKFDAYMRGEAELTEQEARGLMLFEAEDKGNCTACHPSRAEEHEGHHMLPLFTDFTFDNLGVPKNPDNPFYSMDKVYLDDGTPINPMGKDWVDLGLGGFLQSHPNPEWMAMAGENMGKQKVPTLRNVGKMKGNGFIKAYTHNGYFKSLKELVHFYNTRDVEPWPAPEVAQNVNTNELGNLGLTGEEEDAIVAFLLTLSDGYTGN
ncbi:cytochrome C [Maribellus luteus]|uniref:Cytochrome C n=2 Tax=Maribellus luteus TaxID=2305463 RepID=A0A399T0Y2_9BACT|nr:cytochrome C [Maribellus luteus]